MIKAKQTASVFMLLALLMGAVSAPAFALNQIDSLRIWPSPNNTRVVFDLQENPDYTYFKLQNPHRLVIDLADTSRDIDFSQFANQSDLIKRIRHSKPKNSRAVRVVIELTKKLESEIFALPPTAPYKNRLVIDLSDPNKPRSRAVQVVKSSDSASRDRDIIVAIDAGHGGEDPGSIGPTGTYEKNITLSVAKKLAKLIDNERGMRSVLTRTADYFVSVNERPEIARANKADLFVSIHADAFTTPQPRGASVWVLSMKRADTELGRWMERTERHSELLGGAAEVIQDTANERYLAQTLLDMSMGASMASSYELSSKVISELRHVTKMHKRTPQAANFGVLTSPDIPSILVEVGFISNPQEEKNLNWAKFRQNLADSVFEGVKDYFKKSPPDGTLWASLRNENRTHRVRSGESLSLLAQRYNVRVSRD